MQYTRSLAYHGVHILTTKKISVTVMLVILIVYTCYEYCSQTPAYHQATLDWPRSANPHTTHVCFGTHHHKH